jgi:predicted dehydrogenase
MTSDMNRREFLSGAAAAAATFTIVPRRALGGPGYVAPSDKVTLACIGFGTQAIREIGGILASPEVEVVAVCDVDRDGAGYLEWGKNQLRDGIRRLLGDPAWREGAGSVPGGLNVGKEIVDTYYAKFGGGGPRRGCAAYVDFRELLEKERDVTAVKVMTPDHTHAPIALAALRRGLNVIVHKPLANRVLEARAVIEAARAADRATHFLPASEGASQKQALDLIAGGAIGTLREIHNWSVRPMWPQFDRIPADTPPVPPGFDWALWLGPSLDRPYHPAYTHTNFRSWYEFGGGSIADMGHYSLWPIFQALDLDAPFSVESTPTHACDAKDGVCFQIKNDYTFPTACTVRMRFASKGDRPALDIFWYDGGIKPAVPDELMAENRELAAEGMLFVGATGRILGGFRSENPQLIPDGKMRAYRAAHNIPEPEPPQPRPRIEPDTRPRVPARDQVWIDAFKGGPRTYGDFLLAGPICDAINLAAVSLRLGGRRLLWDAAAARITNLSDANALLTREYREGWRI